MSENRIADHLCDFKMKPLEKAYLKDRDYFVNQVASKDPIFVNLSSINLHWKGSLIASYGTGKGISLDLFYVDKQKYNPMGLAPVKEYLLKKDDTKRLCQGFIVECSRVCETMEDWFKIIPPLLCTNKEFPQFANKVYPKEQATVFAKWSEFTADLYKDLLVRDME